MINRENLSKSLVASRALKKDHILKKEDIKVKQVTSLLLGTHNRILTLRLGWEISQFEGEPLMAIMPGIVLAQLWETVGNVEKVLLFMSACVLIVGLLGILIALYSSLNERRREMAILRSIGVGNLKIGMLLISESVFLVSLGLVIGTGLGYASLFLLRDIINKRFGIYFTEFAPTGVEMSFFVIALGASIIMGAIPAYQAYRMSLKDGLAIKF